jgi:hypothetical protein
VADDRTRDERPAIVVVEPEDDAAISTVTS